MTEEELQKRLDEAVADRDRYDVFVEECQDQDVRLRFSPRKDEAWSMPALLALVDTSLRAAAGVDASIRNLSLTVLREAQQADVIALSRAIRCTSDATHAEAWLFSHAVVEPLLHATATLSRRG
jgi:hypothetical protein